MSANGKSWNIIATSRKTWENKLIEELRELGDFRRSGFDCVILGSVDGMEAFLEALHVRWKESFFLQMILSSVVPILTVFYFTRETLLAELKEKVNPLIERMARGSFCVRMKRRGYKGELSSFEMERALGDYIYETLAAQRKVFRVDFSSPDYIIAIETVNNQCGLGIIEKELRERYPFVRIR